MLLSEMRGKSLTDLAGRLVTAVERVTDKMAEDPGPPVDPVGQPKAMGDNYVPMTVETFDNHIFFYASVNTDRCLDLIKRIRQADNDLRNQKMSRSLPKDFPDIPIWLHIQSGGGSLFTGLNMADQLKTISTPIYSIVEGYCASAATLLSMACARRYIMPSAFMLIHQLSSWVAGTYEQLQDDMHVNDMLMARLYGFYEEKTKLKARDLKELMRRDSWFNAEESIEKGLVDEVLK